MGLSEEDCSRFCEDGYLYLPNAFSSSTAMECRQLLWDSLEKEQGIRREDPLTWKKKTSLPKIFTKEDGKPWDEVYSSGIYELLNDICGKEAYYPNTNCGWWMVTFPGFSEQPWESDGRWHVDGHWYRHYPFSSEIGAILVMFFSDVSAEMGGTAVAVGSHKCITRALVHAGTRGLSHSELSFVVSSCMSQTSYPMVELTGRAGDIVVMHPFLIHARSKNLGSSPLPPFSSDHIEQDLRTLQRCGLCATPTSPSSSRCALPPRTPQPRRSSSAPSTKPVTIASLLPPTLHSTVHANTTLHSISLQSPLKTLAVAAGRYWTS
jgi:hypothetical protein